MSKKVFKILALLRACSQPLSMQQRQLAWGTLKYHQKSKFECFSKIQISICRRSTIVCIHYLDFQYKFFLYVFFLSKNGLCMWISAYPLAENDFFLNVPHLFWVWDLGDMYLIHLETRIWRGTFHISFKNGSFGLQNFVVPLGHRGKELFCQLLMLWSCKRWGMSV
jgi:hypothetical protein